MSNETKWTPGPWETDKEEHDQPYLEFRIRPTGNPRRKICEVWQDDAPVVDYNREQIANAHLIAAAPELYDALSKALESLESVWEEEGHYTSVEDIKWIRIVLAKARGES